jgi:hypothetical protein
LKYAEVITLKSKICAFDDWGFLSLWYNMDQHGTTKPTKTPAAAGSSQDGKLLCTRQPLCPQSKVIPNLANCAAHQGPLHRLGENTLTLVWKRGRQQNMWVQYCRVAFFFGSLVNMWHQRANDVKTSDSSNWTIITI